MTRRSSWARAIGAASWLGLVGAAFGGLDWPEFRGPGKQGDAPDANPPLHWGPEKNVAWKAETPGRGWSSPVVSSGRVILTSALLDQDGAPTALRVLAFDRESGGLLWSRDVLSPAGGRRKHAKNSHASPTPLVRDGRVYAHFGHYGVVCLGLDGAPYWTQTSLAYSPVHGNGGSPAFHDGKLVFSCDGKEDPFIVALEADTGEIAWRTERRADVDRKFSFSTPRVIDDGGRSLVITPGSGMAAALDLEDGSEVWRVNYGDGYSVIPRPVIGHGMAFIGTGYGRPWVYAIRLGGRGDVTDSHVVWKTNRGAPHTPSMALAGDELYFVSDGGMASCVDARTGERRWQERVGGNVSASPVVARGRVYVTTEEGKTVVLRVGRRYEVLAENDMEERTLASLALSGRSVFLRTETALYRIEER